MEASGLILDDGVAMYIIDIPGPTEAHDNPPHPNPRKHGLTSAQLSDVLCWLMPHKLIHYEIYPVLNDNLHPTTYYNYVKVYQVSNTNDLSLHSKVYWHQSMPQTKFCLNSLPLTLKL